MVESPLHDHAKTSLNLSLVSLFFLFSKNKTCAITVCNQVACSCSFFSRPWSFLSIQSWKVLS